MKGQVTYTPLYQLWQYETKEYENKELSALKYFTILALLNVGKT